MNADHVLPLAAGAALGVAALVTALAVIVGRHIVREGAETRRLAAVERTRLGALVDWEQKRRSLQ